MTIDSRVILETPEGAHLSLSPAGFWIRGLAYAIDSVIRGAILLVFALVTGQSGMGQGLTLVAYFVLEWFYPVVFEVWRNGQTPGKQALQIRVIHDDGAPVGFSAALIRNLLRAVDFLPFFYVTGVLASLGNRLNQRLGDMAAATLVVHVAQPAARPVILPVGSRPVPDTFDSDEQRWLLAFAQRSGSLSSARQQELAHLLQPLLADPQPVTALQQMANRILGER